MTTRAAKRKELESAVQGKRSKSARPAQRPKKDVKKTALKVTVPPQPEEDPDSMAADTPMAICLAASMADLQQKDYQSVDDADSHESSEQSGGGLMDAYKEVLQSQVSNFECFEEQEAKYSKHFKFEE